MARMFQTIPDLLGGVSQQPATVRAYNEVSRMDNALLSRTDGVRMRPPTQHVGLIDPDISSVPSKPFIHTVKRSETDIYTIAVMNGEIFVYDALTGAQKTVYTPNGMSYLTSVNGFRAATIGDTTVIVNKDVVVEKREGRADPAVNEALIFVKSAQYNNTYRLDFGTFSVNYSTATLGDDNADRTLATEEVATALYGALLGSRQFAMYWTASFYGSSILVSRTDGTDFNLQVTDSLAGSGLILIKKEVQKFEDLPPRARPGMVVKVAGNPLSNKDDYWVKYEEVNSYNESVGGVWREVPAPGASTGFDLDTMPWAVTRYGSLIGTRTVLKDPLAPSITYLGDTEIPKGWNSLDITTGLVLTDNTEASPEIVLTINDESSKDGYVEVAFDVDNYSAKRTETVAISLHMDTGAGYNLQDSIEFWGGERVQNVTLRTPIRNMTAGDKFKVVINTAVSPSVKPRVYLHPGSDPLYPGFKLLNGPHIHVEYPDGALYTEGHVESLRIALFTADNEETNYVGIATATVPAGTTWTASDMNTEQRLNSSAICAIDLAAGTFSVLAAASGFDIYLESNPSLAPWAGSNPDGARSLLGGFLYTSREFTGTSEVCYFDGEAFALDSLVGKTLRNITDGSSGTISDNDVNMLRVASLSGGVHNTFAPGDQIEVLAESDEYFLFDRIPWNDRLSGSDESVPLPSFVGKSLSEVFFFKNRLGLCSGENINLSASGDLFRFFRKTASNLLDDDPIDVTSAHQNIATFDAAVLWKEKLYLFSGAGHQFVITGDPLTPSTAGIQHIGSHQCSLDTRPMTVGDQLFFIRNTLQYSRVMEMTLDENGMALAKDLTKNVPQYVKGRVIDMCGDQNVGSLFFLTDDAAHNKLFVYTYEKDDQGRNLMAAWHTWSFGATSGETTATLPQILTIDMVDGYLYMAITRKGHPLYGYEGVMLEKINLTTPTDNTVMHWDRTGIPNVVAFYTMYVFLSTIYPRDDNGVNITDGILKLQYVNIKYHKVGSIVGQVVKSVFGTPHQAEVFYPSLDGGTSGNLRIAVMAQTERCEIRIQGGHQQGCGFTTISWEGDYHRSRR